MKARTIEKTIRAKVLDWMQTLPVEIQEYVGSKVVVTGGSIASMLLKEPVNDYDIYFKNIKAAMMITRHYCQEWIKKNNEASKAGHVSKNIVPKLRLTLNSDLGADKRSNMASLFKHKESNTYFPDGKMVIHPDDEGLTTLFDSGNYWTEVERVEVFIQSAGMVGQNPDEEYDYFEGREPQVAEDYIDKTIMSEDALEDKGDKYRIVFMSSNAITLSNKVQLVIRFFGEPSKIHDTYDFIHATNYWNMKEGLVTNTKALEAILAKELVYSGSKYPLCSVIRSRKFIQRGWSIHAGNYLKMVMQAGEFDLTDPEVLEEQLTGVDAAYFHQVIQAVKNKKKDDPTFEFNAPYLCTIVDRMMGISEVDESNL